MGKKFASKALVHSLWLMFFFLAGCFAWVAKGSLEKVENFPDLSRFNQKPSAYIEIAPKQSYRSTFKDAVTRVTEQLGVFSSFAFDPPQSQPFDYTIRLELSEETEKPGVLRTIVLLPTLPCAFLGVSPFGVPVPTFDTKFTLSASVQDRTGADRGWYSVEESVTWWCGASLLLAPPFTSDQDVSLWENLVKVLYKKFLDGGLLVYSP